jgi:hypothetical protein
MSLQRNRYDSEFPEGAAPRQCTVGVAGPKQSEHLTGSSVRPSRQERNGAQFGWRRRVRLWPILTFEPATALHEREVLSLEHLKGQLPAQVETLLEGQALCFRGAHVPVSCIEDLRRLLLSAVVILSEPSNQIVTGDVGPRRVVHVPPPLGLTHASLAAKPDSHPAAKIRQQGRPHCRSHG